MLEDRGSKNGTYVNGQRIHDRHLKDGDVIELGHTLFIIRPALTCRDPHGQQGDDTGESPDENLSASGLRTVLPDLSARFAHLARVARTEISVLLCGESGTGKEVVARAIHAQSRRPGPFIAINCGAIPENLVESELFGSCRGDFSGGVVDRPGLVRSANTGTLFLDEIGDLPLGSQAALLRVLEQREVVPVGEATPVPVDIRVVAATHRDLDAMVASGAFRQDAYARFSAYSLTLPPLRERREDIGLMIAEILPPPDRSSEPPALDRDAARCLLAHGWPLNIRELKNALQTAQALSSGARLALEHLPETVRRAVLVDPGAAEEATLVPRDPGPPDGLSDEDRVLRHELIVALRRHRGNVAAVARELSKDRKQIHRWMKRLGLSVAAYRS